MEARDPRQKPGCQDTGPEASRSPRANKSRQLPHRYRLDLGKRTVLITEHDATSHRTHSVPLDGVVFDLRTNVRSYVNNDLSVLNGESTDYDVRMLLEGEWVTLANLASPAGAERARHLLETICAKPPR